MTNLDPEKLQLPPMYFFLSVYSFKEDFFPQNCSCPFIVFPHSILLPSTTFLLTVSSQPSFLMRRQLSGFSNPHASSPNQLHGESLGTPTAAQFERWRITQPGCEHDTCWYRRQLVPGFRAAAWVGLLLCTGRLYRNEVKARPQAFILASVPGGRDDNGPTE